MDKFRTRASVKSKDKAVAATAKAKHTAIIATRGNAKWKAEIAVEKNKGPPGIYKRTSAKVAADERGKRAAKRSNSVERNNSVELNKKNNGNRFSSSSLLQMDQGDLRPVYGSYQCGVSGFPDNNLLSTARKPYATEVNLLSARNTRETLESTTVALDVVITDLSRRRLTLVKDFSFCSPVRMSRDALQRWEIPCSTSHASLESRQKQLHQQYQELELRQKELEIQRQKLLAGIQEHAESTATSPIERNQQQHEEEEEEEEAAAAAAAAAGGTVNIADFSSSFSPAPDPQNWWVCQICNTKAFASRDDAMAHELNCCPEPQRFEKMAADMYVSPDTIPPLEDLGGMCDSSSFFPEVVEESSVSDIDPSPEDTGPFDSMKYPMALAMESDKYWLTPLHCYVREHCVEVFTASSIDIARPTRGKRKPIKIGQVGIRCPHCASADSKRTTWERGSVYYPTSIASVYNATMNLLQRHLDKCSAIPNEILECYKTLKGDDARSGTSKQYWIESALSFGMVDTPNGIRLSAFEPPLLPFLSNQQLFTRIKRIDSNDTFATKNDASDVLNPHDRGKANSLPVDALEDSVDLATSPHMRSPGPRCPSPSRISPSPVKSLTLAAVSSLVEPTDDVYSTGFSFELISQMQRCVFTEADRLGKRKGLPVGFPGLACRHCFGGFGSGRFFPSSIKTLSDTSKTLNVIFNHMKKCRLCPKDTQTKLEKLRETHDDERSAMKFGSQKAFFANVWGRIHLDGNPGTMPNKSAPAKTRKKKSPPSLAEESPPLAIPLPHLTTSLFDPDHFAPSLVSGFGLSFGPVFGPTVATEERLPRHNSFSALESPSGPMDAPASKRQKSA